MENPTDSYLTLASTAGPVEIREKKSKFIGYAFPVDTVEAARARIAELGNAYPDATHLCYAYRIGTDRPEKRINDDGEPSHTAGTPIFGQIESFSLFDVLVCVIRYYGGTKLGAGGLIQAYRETALQCLQQAKILRKHPVNLLVLRFEYADLDAVLRLIDQHQLLVAGRKMDLSCRIDLEVRARDTDKVRKLFAPLTGVDIRKSS